MNFDSTSIYVVRTQLAAGRRHAGRVAVRRLRGDARRRRASTRRRASSTSTTTPHQGYVIGVDNVWTGRLVAAPRSATPAPRRCCRPNVVITRRSIRPAIRFRCPHQGGRGAARRPRRPAVQAVIRNGRLWTSHHFEVNSLGEAGPGGAATASAGTSCRSSPATAVAGPVGHGAGIRPAPTPPSYWLGAIMPNGQGHVALGMSTAGTAPAGERRGDRPSGRRPGRDHAGAGDLQPTHVVLPTTCRARRPPSRRWGGSSSTSVDPDDDMTMWTLQQFVDAADSYGLRLVRIQAPPPAVIASVSPNTLASGLTGATADGDRGSATGGTGLLRSRSRVRPAARRGVQRRRGDRDRRDLHIADALAPHRQHGGAAPGARTLDGDQSRRPGARSSPRRSPSSAPARQPAAGGEQRRPAARRSARCSTCRRRACWPTTSIPRASRSPRSWWPPPPAARSP